MIINIIIDFVSLFSCFSKLASNGRATRWKISSAGASYDAGPRFVYNYTYTHLYSLI